MLYLSLYAGIWQKRPTGIICSWFLWQVQLVDMLVRRFVFITISCSCQHNFIVVRGFFMWQRNFSCDRNIAPVSVVCLLRDISFLPRTIFFCERKFFLMTRTSVLTGNQMCFCMIFMFFRQSRIFPDCSNFLPNAFWSLYIEFQCESNKNTGIISALELLFWWQECSSY